jgi:hypothetical protein
VIEAGRGEARTAITAAAACAAMTPGVAPVRVSPGWTAFTLTPEAPDL